MHCSSKHLIRALYSVVFAHCMWENYYIRKSCRKGNCSLWQWLLRLMGNVVPRVCIHGLHEPDIFNDFVYIYRSFSFFLHKPKSHSEMLPPLLVMYQIYKKRKYQQPEQSIKTFRRIFLSVKLKSVAVLRFVILIYFFIIFLFCWLSPQLAADKQQQGFFFSSSRSD